MARHAEQTPRQLGFRMPPEWHPHEATWLAWPKDPQTWPERVPEAQEVFLRMIRVLTPHEKVHLLVDDAETETTIRRRTEKLSLKEGGLIFHHIPTVDSWIRDYGPNFLLRQPPGSPELAFNDWHFNAWGGKYRELERDTTVPERLTDLLSARRFQPGIVMEGGSIDVNGQGLCLTTEQCLLNPNRNPDLSRAELEGYLRDFLGAEEIIWLGQGIAGDDTDGHVDDIARFTDEHTVVCAVEEDTQDENYHLLQDNLARLRALCGQREGIRRIETIPMPGRLETPEGPLPASYVNFYIANRVVLVPIFGHRNDAIALGILQRLFPDREICGIRCEALVWGLGAIHCVTQQQPACVAAG